MLKCFLFLIVSVCIQLATGFRSLIFGPGRWLVLNIELCENPEEYEIIYSISRKKINRTHDCFDATLELDREINTTYAVQIDVFQKVYGGRFQYYQSVEDECACTFIMKHAKETVTRALTMANIDPPDCPLEPGPIIIKNFVMDYRQMPKHGMYGTFRADVHILYNKVRIGCVRVILNFDELKNYESDDDDDYD